MAARFTPPCLLCRKAGNIRYTDPPWPLFPGKGASMFSGSKARALPLRRHGCSGGGVPGQAKGQAIFPMVTRRTARLSWRHSSLAIPKRSKYDARCVISVWAFFKKNIQAAQAGEALALPGVLAVSRESSGRRARVGGPREGRCGRQFMAGRADSGKRRRSGGITRMSLRANFGLLCFE